MQIIDILRLILLILLCSAATVTDIKQGIISNRLVLIAGVSGIILSCFEHSMLMDQFFNCLILAGFGLFFYGSHIWAGGDTKLLFPGHIACDAASRSEIVVPLFGADGEVAGVLDLDSISPARFTKKDAEGLEAFARIIEREVLCRA